MLRGCNLSNYFEVFCVSLFVGRLVSSGARICPLQEPKLDANRENLLQLVAHRPIAIDSAGADISGEGDGGVEPGPSNVHGGCGACIDQVVVPTAHPCPNARDKNALRHHVVSERRLPKPPKCQHRVSKHFTLCAKQALVNSRSLHNVSGTYARRF